MSHAHVVAGKNIKNVVALAVEKKKVDGGPGGFGMCGSDERTDESMTDGVGDGVTCRSHSSIRGIVSRLLSGFLLTLPLWAVVGSLVCSCAASYSEGVGFVKGLYGCLFATCAILIGIIFLVALTIAFAWF